MEAPRLSDGIGLKTVAQELKMQAFGSEPHRALELSIQSPVQLGTLHSKDDRHKDVILAPGDVEIGVLATGLGLRDVRVALGQMPGDKLGSECAGIVTRIGEAVDTCQVRQVCCCTNKAAFKTYARAQAMATLKVPNDISYTRATSLPVAFCVAYYSLFQLPVCRKANQPSFIPVPKPLNRSLYN